MIYGWVRGICKRRATDRWDFWTATVCSRSKRRWPSCTARSATPASRGGKRLSGKGLGNCARQLIKEKWPRCGAWTWCCRSKKPGVKTRVRCDCESCGSRWRWSGQHVWRAPINRTIRATQITSLRLGKYVRKLLTFVCKNFISFPRLD